MTLATPVYLMISPQSTAERRFAQLMSLGFIAATRSGPGEQRLIHSFDTSADESVFH